MNTLENNLEKIQRYNPALADKIARHTFAETTQFELVQAGSGDVNLIYNGVKVHSDINPQEEAISVFGNLQDASESSITLLVGLGLGYLFKRLCMSSKGKIIVYEPNLDILRFTLEVVDFSAELAEDRVFIANSKLEYVRYLDEIYVHKAVINICGLPSCFALYPDEINTLKADLPQIQSHLDANYACLFEKSYLWLTQGITNLPILAGSYNIDSLRDKFKSKPAVIISSGPSLDKGIEYLLRNRDKVIIFCVGNAYTTLAKYNIKPDFLVFIEAYDVSHQVNGLDISDINQIIQPITNNNVISLNTKRKFIFYGSNDLVSRWISDIASFSVSEYETKGSVSYCALYSAYMMGCNPLILLGQDLAYVDGKCYSSGSSYGALKCIFDDESGKFKVVIEDEEELFNHILLSSKDDPKDVVKRLLSRYDGRIVPVKGQNGDILPTDLNYASFVQFLSEFAYENSVKGLELINSSTGGAQIDGFSNIELTQVLENLPLLDINIDSIINDTLSSYNEPVTEKFELIKNRMRKIIDDIDKYKPCSNDGLALSAQLSNMLNKEAPDINRIKPVLFDLEKKYYLLKDKLFCKYEILNGCMFKELLEAARILENDQKLNSIEDLKVICRVYNSFFSGFNNYVITFKNLMSETLAILSK